ncbi:right-handed parallel beta-helix repeat-containing protein [Treponema parvum]|uniref:right-handed parallel beta-helix repeat-containing protein n=1 Tax=Treponema parvum TaxID=138851 RepID=UPI001AEC5D90|nr:right-handed parallel beta-helix repeat-containing protein [Treponema parvum]QTQ15598.1 right-handed parallel beta-helix repeat-containing protein [Treponema parvum]
MKYYVSKESLYGGDGTRERPFKWINDAAKIAVAGDEIIVAPGVYREYVDPVNKGTHDARIVYRSEVKGKAVITGAEEVKNWVKFKGNVWSARVSNGIFGNYNPYTEKICGDWYFSEIPLHTGEVYLNGASMYETDSIENVLSPHKYEGAWDQEFSVYRWFSEQKDGATYIYANFHGADPNKENVEINVRRNCFYPSKTGVDYITFSGFTVKQAATTWAPPTAYQEGMVGPHWSKGWIIEDCEISDSKCCGISLGKYLQPENENKWTFKRLKHGTQTERDSICQAQVEGWTKENIGSHIVRRCDIHHCEQTGIVGHLGCVFSIIEDNHIHHINNKQQLAGAEIGGIKLHAAIDVQIRRNHIHHCTRGLWLDWQAQGTRVTQNLFHDNSIPVGTKVMSALAIGEDLFIEVSHGPTLVDNNIFLSVYAGRIATQGTAYVHNLICGPFTSVGGGTDNGKNGGPRYTPYHFPHRTEVAGFMTFMHGDDRFYNNIFVKNEVPKEYDLYWEQNKTPTNNETGTVPFDDYPCEEEYLALFFKEGDAGAKEDRGKYYTKLPVYTGGNVFFNGAKPCKKEKNFKEVSGCKVYAKVTEKDGKYYFETDLFKHLPEFETDLICTETLGKAFEPEQKFENPDGTQIIFDKDYFDNKRGISPIAGPFADKELEFPFNLY